MVAGLLPAAEKTLSPPLEAAKREAREEAQIKGELPFLQLQTIVPIRAVGFPDRHLWDDDVHVIPITVLV